MRNKVLLLGMIFGVSNIVASSNQELKKNIHKGTCALIGASIPSRMLFGPKWIFFLAGAGDQVLRSGIKPISKLEPLASQLGKAWESSNPSDGMYLTMIEDDSILRCQIYLPEGQPKSIDYNTQGSGDLIIQSFRNFVSPRQCSPEPTSADLKSSTENVVQAEARRSQLLGRESGVRRQREEEE